ncbi:MAG: DNA-binding transcriptional LysR family regulator [Parasphingorhabdus sp.]|jgi:DNA-binding transcriptional LysR family regulator
MEYDRLPDINGWAALRAVVDGGGVVAAANALNVGQPAITKRLRALEQAYGMPLVERSGRSLALTTAGELVYRLATETLDKQLALRESLQLLANGHNQLRLEMSVSVGEYFLSGWLMDFNRDYPQFRIRSRLGYGREIEARLSRGLVDVAILEAAPERSNILVQPWIEDELWLVCGPTHELANSNMISLDRLKNQRFVLRETRSSLRDHLDEALRRIGINQISSELEAGSNRAIMEVIEEGDLVSFLPRFFVAGPVARKEIRRVKVKSFRIIRTLWIARLRDRLDHPAAEAFVEMLNRQRTEVALER